MKTTLSALMIAATALFLFGMGDLGGVPAGSVPQTSEDIHVAVTDRSGVRTELSRFSMDGSLFIEGARGSGKLSVDFKKIASLEFGPVNGDRVEATLQLKGGKSLELMILRRAVFYGDTGYGAFKISGRDLQRIEFL